jgi:hypothetical protein
VAAAALSSVNSGDFYRRLLNSARHLPSETSSYPKNFRLTTS